MHLKSRVLQVCLIKCLAWPRRRANCCRISSSQRRGNLVAVVARDAAEVAPVPRAEVEAAMPPVLAEEVVSERLLKVA